MMFTDSDSDDSEDSRHSFLVNDELVQAAKDGDWTEISKQISEGTQVDSLLQDDEKKVVTLLVLASRHGHLECVQRLIEMGATKDHENAMFAAAKKGHVECFRLLMYVKFCHEITDNESIVVLLNALKKENFESILEILKGSDLKDTLGELGSQLMNLLVVHGCPTSCVQALMDSGVDVNQKANDSGLTPLTCSIYANNFDSIHFLIQNGAKLEDIDPAVFCRDDQCLEELVKLVEREQIMCYMDWIINIENASSMRILLKYLDNIDSKDKCGMTLLMWASRKNSLPWVEFLLKNGANANFRSNRGDTALTIACSNGHFRIVEMLLKHKVDINAQFLNVSPNAAVPQENMLRKLYDHKAEMGYCSLGDSALSVACSEGHDDIVDVLLKFGANVFLLTPQKYSVIMMAAVKNHVNCVKRLVQFSFPLINQKNDEGQTALMLSCRLGRDEAVDALLKNKADVNAQDCKGKTALMYAVQLENNVKCVQLLLEYKANVHLRNKHGRTALMVSCTNDNDQVLDILISHGSELDLKNVKGRTALMYATVNESLLCLQKLLEHGADTAIINKEGYTALMIACIRGYDKIVDLLLKNKAALDVQNEEGKSAIMFASCCRQTDKSVKVIPKLVEWGADVNIRTYSGDSALTYAAAVGHTEVVEVLFKCGADINGKNKVGRTALMFALAREHTECVQKLVALGADLDVHDMEGNTVFSITIGGDHYAFKLLLESGRLVDDMGLKSIHKDAIMKQDNISFTFANLVLAMKKGLFDWNWCLVASSLQIIVHAAVVSGISPGKIDYKGDKVSPLYYAYSDSDYPSVSFILSNLYFHADDYRHISQNVDMRVLTVDHHGDHVTELLIKSLLVQTLSLKTWSFLTISESISCAGTTNSRADQVNKLPLPEMFKKALKFKTKASRSCLDDLQDQDKNNKPGDLIFTNTDDDNHDDYCEHCVDMIESDPYY